jgi:hypothetical protein
VWCTTSSTPRPSGSTGDTLRAGCVLGRGDAFDGPDSVEVGGSGAVLDAAGAADVVAGCSRDFRSSAASAFSRLFSSRTSVVWCSTASTVRPSSSISAEGEGDVCDKADSPVARPSAGSAVGEALRDAGRDCVGGDAFAGADAAAIPLGGRLPRRGAGVEMGRNPIVVPGYLRSRPSQTPAVKCDRGGEGLVSGVFISALPKRKGKRGGGAHQGRRSPTRRAQPPRSLSRARAR